MSTDQQFQQTLADLLRKNVEGFKFDLLALSEEKTKQAMEHYKVREEEFPIVLVLTKDENQVEKRLPQEQSGRARLLPSGDGDNVACEAFYQITGKLIERTNPKDGAAMVYVPAGEFLMGTDPDEINKIWQKFGWKEEWKKHAKNESPKHRVYVDGFWMYKYEIASFLATAQYRKFCQETGRQMPPVKPSWGWQDNHPIILVTWDDAVAYCNWAGVQLPTEAQWEKAERGTDGRIWPWGNEAPDAGGLYRANYYLANDEDGYRYTAPVGSFPLGASPYGLMDMAGNVWEWCADWYDENYYASAPNRNPPGPSSGTGRVLRGGSWFNPTDLYNLRAATRGEKSPGTGSDLNGFRGVPLRLPR